MKEGRAEMILSLRDESNVCNVWGFIHRTILMRSMNLGERRWSVDKIFSKGMRGGLM